MFLCSFGSGLLPRGELTIIDAILAVEITKFISKVSLESN